MLTYTVYQMLGLLLHSATGAHTTWLWRRKYGTRQHGLDDFVSSSVKWSITSSPASGSG